MCSASGEEKADVSQFKGKAGENLTGFKPFEEELQVGGSQFGNPQNTTRGHCME